MKTHRPQVSLTFEVPGCVLVLLMRILDWPFRSVHEVRVLKLYWNCCCLSGQLDLFKNLGKRICSENGPVSDFFSLP